jgi:hypothetical protein
MEAKRITTEGREEMMNSARRYGGIVAGLVLIAFGIGAIYMGIDGRSTVRDALAEEGILATPDAATITDGKLQPNEKVDTGAEARQFALIMRHHALEATEGQTYAQMGRFLDDNGNPTSDESKAAVDPKTGQPVENGLRNMWVTSTALTTALNTAYFAESVATFAIVMGIALLLTGIGFLVLTILVLRPAGQRVKTERGASAVPVAG